MNTDIIQNIASNLGVNVKQVEVTLKLLDEGNTIPFISRYRKEVTGSLDEEQIRSISEVHEYEVNLLKRKEDVIRLIDEKGLMSDELKNNIMSSKRLVEVEDLYRPYKEKKKTKATDAINNGLEPLAKIFLNFPTLGSIESICADYLNDKVKTIDEAVVGAKYIIAEIISDDASIRKWLRSYTFNSGILETKLKKNAVDETLTYEMYYDYKESIKNIKAHRVMALNRAENEKIISVSIKIDEDFVIKYINSKIIKNESSFVTSHIKSAIKDSYDRLISPSIEREIRSELTSNSEEVAINNFMKNLSSLLLTPPMKEKIVLGFDPAFRTGCKLAVMDTLGRVLNISVIYPHEPKNEVEASRKKVLELIDKYNVDIIAIGNGTASRESEAFIADVISSAKTKVEYIIVNEAGASVYSASKLAISEFPDLHVEERSAISIGRRLQDPLSELVKIDPKSIGVGLYQHDVNQTRLSDSLDFIVTSSVNSVGVNINTASNSLLRFVSGLNKRIIDNLLEYREKNGKFNSRDELKKVKAFGDKAYEQAIGFIRIINGSNKLDETMVHPESYDITLKLLNRLEYSLSDIGSDELKIKLDTLNKEEIKDYLKTDMYTLEDIIKSLKSPLRDPRDDFDKPLLKSDILHLEDLKVGMMLQGTVRNVVDFGIFIDIGLKNDGLAHISKLTNKYIKHPSELFSVGDIVNCFVDEIFIDKKKVALSLLKK